ncbi:MAG: hypothetical protein LBV69_07205 [Bacteroidales bacterium]|jgi:hypothetical protein|nr:hypothetical protein [Bacteroidales bacterium]
MNLNLNNILKELYSPNPISRIDLILPEIHNDVKLIEELVNYSFSNNKEAWRVSWLLSKYSEKYPNSLKKYTEKFIENSKNLKIDGHLRQNLRIIFFLDLNEEELGEIFDICLNIFQDNKRQSSLRCIAFQILLKNTQNYPELKSELISIFENHKDYLTTEIKSSITKKIITC